MSFVVSLENMNRVALRKDVESLQNLMVSIACGGDRTTNDYSELRLRLVNEPAIKEKLPEFVVTCRDGNQFWGFIKYKYPSYHERRQFIWGSFSQILSYLEADLASPSADTIEGVLKAFDSEHVYVAWQKAFERRLNDPEGALTASRTLLESVCKHILDGLAVPYKDSADLPDLYSLVSQSMNLSPSQHTEQIFKQILGGCHSVVQGLGALRNKLSDAHGKGVSSYKPATRHAALAVNLSGAMSMFLVETYENIKEKKS